MTTPEIQPAPPKPERRRFQYSLKHLLIGTAVFALLLGIWTGYIRKAVDVRKADASDATYERYFGFELEDMKARNILVATGTFTTSTWLSGTLFLVQGGSVSPVNGWTVGRSSNQIGASIWKSMKITLALGEKDTPNGRVTNLGAAGQSRGGGSGSGVPITVSVTSSLAVPGRILPGANHIVYVEGDRDPVVDQAMSVDEFARKNAGNYLVVTLQLQ
jgi:hypothetical protein